MESEGLHGRPTAPANMNHADMPQSRDNGQKEDMGATGTSLVAVASAIQSFSPAKKAQELWQAGRDFTKRAHDLLKDSDELAGTQLGADVTTHELATHVTVALRKQQEINKASLGLGGLNYTINMVNSVANKQLQERVQTSQEHVEELKTTVLDQSCTIEELNDSICELQSESALHKSDAERLRQSLKDNAEMLQSSLLQLRLEKQAQDLMLAEHQVVLAQIKSKKLKHDTVVDLVSAAASLYVVNMWLVDGPLRLAMSLVPRQRLRRWLRQFSKASLFFLLLRWIRSYTRALGIHNSIGGASSYLYWMLGSLKWLMAKSVHSDAQPQTSFATPEPTPPPTPRAGYAGIATPSQWRAD